MLFENRLDADIICNCSCTEQWATSRTRWLALSSVSATQCGWVWGLECSESAELCVSGSWASHFKVHLDLNKLNDTLTNRGASPSGKFLQLSKVWQLPTCRMFDNASIMWLMVSFGTHVVTCCEWQTADDSLAGNRSTWLTGQHFVWTSAGIWSLWIVTKELRLWWDNHRLAKYDEIFINSSFEVSSGRYFIGPYVSGFRSYVDPYV